MIIFIPVFSAAAVAGAWLGHVEPWAAAVIMVFSFLSGLLAGIVGGEL